MAESGRPLLPEFTQPLGLTFDGEVPVHGVVFLGGEYSELAGFNPVIESAGILGEPAAPQVEPSYQQAGWWPALPVRASRLPATDGGGVVVGTAIDARATAWLAQYRGTADGGPCVCSPR